jgi:hypothetical protein
MKTLVALALVAMMAGASYADEWGGVIGLFFEEGDTYTGAHLTNSDVLTTSGFAGPFAWAYLVFLNPGGAVEDLALIEFSVKSAEWVEGWVTPTLFGPTPNYVTSAEAIAGGGYSAQFAWPNTYFPIDADAVALCRWRLLNWVGDPSTLRLGPITHLPATLPGQVGIVYQGTMRYLTFSTGPCEPPDECEEVDEDGFVTVATFMDDGVIATEDHTLSSVKALFR